MDDITPGHQRYVEGEISAFDYVDKCKVNMGDLCRFCEELGYGGVKRFYRFDSFKKFREITMETNLLLAIDRHQKREVHIWLDAEKPGNRSAGDGGVLVGAGGVSVGDGDRSVPVGDGDRSVPVDDRDEGDQSEDEDFCAKYVEAEECVEGPKQKEYQHEVDDEMSTDSSRSNCTEDSSHDDFSSCSDSDEENGENEETESKSSMRSILTIQSLNLARSFPPKRCLSKSFLTMEC
ncbi:ATPases [Striga asiatica]|uniref:ATPases n=1 Tax=Striga asiatica TaxID=4170 RepID=A0A5A7QH35_STRAF|nr:ATPases [Striga asiatica]